MNESYSNLPIEEKYHLFRNLFKSKEHLDFAIEELQEWEKEKNEHNRQKYSIEPKCGFSASWY